MTIPIYIIAYNNLYFIRNMVSQLEKYTTNIHIIDNASTYPKLLNYYTSEYKYDLIKMDKNYGHEVYIKQMYNLLPEKFIITDPDLQLNPDLPANFIDELDRISEKFKYWKVGFALDIKTKSEYLDDPQLGDYKWEEKFWVKRLEDRSELYDAQIDTTFCLCNKKYYKNHPLLPAIRVAGCFTAIHLPWYINTWINYPRDELEYYRVNNISSTILKFVDKWFKLIYV